MKIWITYEGEDKAPYEILIYQLVGKNYNAEILHSTIISSLEVVIQIDIHHFSNVFTFTVNQEQNVL